jgi:hypothetical protein
VDRCKIDAHTAFGVLLPTSQDQDIKLAAVARRPASRGRKPAG